jgi:hypothetical protein
LLGASPEKEFTVPHAVYRQTHLETGATIDAFRSFNDLKEDLAISSSFL